MLETRIEMVCSFCNAKVEYGKSVCEDCKKKYHIGLYDMSNDGCGCDS